MKHSHKVRKNLEKKNRTEAIKTFFIVFLAVLFCFQGFLIFRTTSVYNILFNSSFFGSKIILDDEDVMNLYFEYTAPEYIMANHDGSRDIYYSDNKNYKDALLFVEEINRNIFLPDAEIEYIEDGLFDKLTEIDSLYVSYPYEKYTKYSAQFLNNTNEALSSYVSSYTKLIIVPETADEQKNATVYIKDSKSEKAVKISTSVTAEALKKFLKATKSLNRKDYSFAHELNLNKISSSNTVSAPAVEINDNIVIPLKNLSFPKISVHPPALLSGESSSETAEKIMNAFGFTPETARRYSDNSGFVCVDEKATLKISPSGIIEYTALTKESGYNLTGSSNVSSKNIYFLSFTGISRIINSIIPLAENSEKSFKVRLTELQSESVDVPEYKFMFDYYINGIRTINAPFHAIEATVKDGRLTFMRFDLKYFSSTSEEVIAEPLFSAIDEFYSLKNGQEHIKIENAFLSYPLYKESEKISAHWALY